MKKAAGFIGVNILLLVYIFWGYGGDIALDEQINQRFEPITDFLNRTVFASFDFVVNDIELGIPLVLVWLVAGAIYFTIHFNFVNFRLFKTSLNIVRGKYSDPNEKGEVSHFQALTAALSGTVGLGNIGGVAIAISMGGAGATFWMIIAGLLGMSSKFVECTLGVKYRNITDKGVVHGGPMYYLSKGFASMSLTTDGKTTNFAKMGKVLAGIFAIACIGGSFGGGNMYQANQAYKQLAYMPEFQGTWLQDHGWLFGLIMAVMVAIVIIGGIKSIAKVTDKIVPFMVGVYVLAALFVLISFFDQIPAAFGQIFSEAFTGRAMGGGVIFVMIQGFRRAAFSNEAGIGSASIAHSAVKTDHPASEGLVALLEPFIDTVIICTMTALVIIITNNHDTGSIEGVQLTSRSFGMAVSWFPYVLTVAIVLFAFSTMISWSYYGLQAWTYLFGDSKIADLGYKFLFCLFVIVGASTELGPVIGFSDAMIFLMCFPNIFGMYFLAPVVKQELQKYLSFIKEKYHA